MIKSLSILFYIRKDKTHSNGNAPIYCRITVEGQRSVFAIQRTVHPQKWDSVKGAVKGNTEEAKSLNAYITLLTNRVYEAQHKLEEANSIITSHAIKDILIGNTHKKSRSVFSVFEDHNNKIKSLIGTHYSFHTHERFQTTINHLREFVLWKYNRTDYALHEVNHEFINELDYYLRSQKHTSNNTTVKYVRNFKKIIRIALANSWITFDPFINYTMRIKKTDRGYLTQQELDLLMEKHFPITRVEQVRDIFVFMCYTGLAYIDAKKLTKVNLYRDVKNVFWVKTKRTKTGTEVSVPLLPNAVEILEKYSSNSATSDGGYLLPVLSNQKMNAYLSEIE
jgi:hypothetical protein